MSRQVKLIPRYVDTIPFELEEGVIYISKKYSTSMHSCCCGCKEPTVTPLDPTKGWVLTEDGDTVTLRPSIGNFKMSCRSHYYITKNCVDWL